MPTRPRLFTEPAGSYFLLGPRGTGKSSLLKARHPQSLYLDLLDAETERELLARPERLRQRMAAAPRHLPVIIDEVQRVPALLDAVHALIQQDRRTFILSGSSARKLRRGGTNLLGGRAALRTLGPYVAAELGGQFDLSHALQFGLIPLVVEAAHPADVLRSYAGLYVREEVRAEAFVRNHGDFARFLEIAAFSHGAELNLSALARECDITRRTADGYLGVIEDLLLGVRLPVFARRAARALTAHPKFYYFDTGLYRSQRSAGPLDRPEEIAGPALEGLVFQHLRTWIAAHPDHSLHFWRTRSGVEVDFVIYGPREFVAIEVKHSARRRSSDLSPLRAFSADYPEAHVALLDRAKHREVEYGVTCLPVEDFLRQLQPEGSLADALSLPGELAQ
jgi:predicted AAA+ superfamily ATPase